MTQTVEIRVEASPFAASRTTRLRDAIVQLIIGRRLVPGSDTSEDQICRLLNNEGEPDISRTPVRLALAVLEAQGFVVKRPQVGSHIVAVDPDEVQEILTLRVGIDGNVFVGLAAEDGAIWAATHAPQGRRSSHELDDSADSFLLDERDFHAGAALAAGFGTGAALLRVWGDRFRVLNTQTILRTGHPVLDGDACSRLKQEHVELVETVRNGDRERARECVTAHIQSLETYLLT